MSNIVKTSARKLKMTEADLFRSAFWHSGRTAPHLWREAYEMWCEREQIPKNGYENWFLDICIDIVCGKLILLPINDNPCTSTQYMIPNFIEVKPDTEDDGN